MSADEMSEKEKSTGERIAELAKERGLTLRKLAILSGVPYNTLYSAVKRKSDRVDRKIIEKISKALNVDIRKILSDDQFIHDWSEDAIRRYPTVDVVDLAIHVCAHKLNYDGRIALLNYAEELTKRAEYKAASQEEG